MRNFSGVNRRSEYCSERRRTVDRGRRIARNLFALEPMYNPYYAKQITDQRPEIHTESESRQSTKTKSDGENVVPEAPKSRIPFSYILVMMAMTSYTRLSITGIPKAPNRRCDNNRRDKRPALQKNHAQTKTPIGPAINKGITMFGKNAKTPRKTTSRQKRL